MDLHSTTSTIIAESFQSESEHLFSRQSKITHDSVLQEILDHLKWIDFRAEADIDEKKAVPQKVQVVISVRYILKAATELNFGLWRYQDRIYSYNGEFWKDIDPEDLKIFLGKCAEKLGVDSLITDYHKFIMDLYNQFFIAAYSPKPKRTGQAVLINLQNGTGEISKDGIKIRPFSRIDFLTYQLSFVYNPAASYTKWQSFLDEVLPEKDKAGNVVDEGKSRQKVLAEFIAYIFTTLKLEKTLILLGGGANGKSVFFDVIKALLGKENISSYSLESLGEHYFRAMLANKLLNYTSELSSCLQAEKFKQLTSGEPIEARLPYGKPMIIDDYAKLAFNTNELPKDVEHTLGFFRRFLIIPFDVTIPEEKRNPELAGELIDSELAGVFNWILEGLTRLLEQNGFSKCEAANKAVEAYRLESDSVAVFIEEEGYKKSADDHQSLKDLYPTYKTFCVDNGFRHVHSRNLGKRLEALGFETAKRNFGKIIYLKK